MSTKKFSLRARSTPIEIEGLDGAAEKFELREMSAAQRDQYLDLLRPRFTPTVDGKMGEVVKYEGLQSDLLSRTLFRPSSGKFVTAAEIQAYPATLVSDLFSEAQILNRLIEDKKENAVKND